MFLFVMVFYQQTGKFVHKEENVLMMMSVYVQVVLEPNVKYHYVLEHQQTSQLFVIIMEIVQIPIYVNVRMDG